MSTRIQHDRRDLDMSGITAVEAATFNGDLTVETGSGPAWVDITVRGSAILDIERIGDLLYIKASKKGFSFSGAEVNLHLRLPEELALKLASVNGVISLRGAARKVEARLFSGAVRTNSTGRADLNVRVSSGRVDIVEAKGRVDVATSNGPVRVEGAGEGVHVATSNGPVDVVQANGNIHITSSNGSIAIMDCVGEVQITSSHGDTAWERVTLAPHSRNWIKSSAGTVHITGLRAPDGAQIRAKTAHLPIHIDLPEYDIEIHHSRLVATLAGAHPARLEVTTTRELHISA